MGAVFHASKWDFGLLNSSFFSNVNLVVLCIALGEMEEKRSISCSFITYRSSFVKSAGESRILSSSCQNERFPSTQTSAQKMKKRGVMFFPLIGPFPTSIESVRPRTPHFPINKVMKMPRGPFFLSFSAGASVLAK